MYLPRLNPVDEQAVARDLARAIATQNPREGSLAASVGEAPYQLYYNRLNADSLYPPAYEVSVYPLAGLIAQQRQLRWQILGAGALLLLAGLALSGFLAGRLAGPVEKLAVDSAENLAQRTRAEAALESTSEELQRAARFSADASHQLKTPLAVLRAGLEELQARPDLSTEVNHEIAALTHQTYRLSSVIDDLLLLSRMDAGQLKLNFGPVDLSQLIEASLDDLGAQPEASGLVIERNFPAELPVVGDRHYTGLILQNLLENARKYNWEDGRIRLTARRDEDRVFLAIGNTGQGIPLGSQARIFERFHRGSMGENIPGYGLGLNLARELARLHGGGLRLVSSASRLDGIRGAFLRRRARGVGKQRRHMKALWITGVFWLTACDRRRGGRGRVFDQLGEALTFSSPNGGFRARLSGTLWISRTTCSPIPPRA